MSRNAQLACDAGGCDAVWPERPVSALNRREARKAGWSRSYDSDLCPDHSDKTQLVEEVRRLAAAGLRDGEIGRQVGAKRATVQSLRRRNGIVGQRTGRPAGSAVAA
jgi:hypothetical protein